MLYNFISSAASEARVCALFLTPFLLSAQLQFMPTNDQNAVTSSGSTNADLLDQRINCVDAEVIILKIAVV